MNTSLPTIALAGAPNSGKTSLFNTLTGSSQKVGNYPGVTIEKKTGKCETPKGNIVRILDLPGTYSLSPQSIDEQIAYDVLHHKSTVKENYDLILAVTDATNLERTLGLVLELKKLNTPIIVVLNMIDLATKRGLKIDIQKLELELELPVIEAVATQKKSLDKLFNLIDEKFKTYTPKNESNPIEKIIPTPSEIAARFETIDKILDKVVIHKTRSDILTHKLDNILLHKVWGTLILVLTLILMFQAVFSWAEAPMGWIEDSISWLGDSVKSLLPSGAIQSLISDGIIAGVGSVLVFLPQILILFFFIFLLEGTGYMARAAFLIDKLMSSIGLQGRSFVPLLSSFACAIPGIMATRTIKNPKDRYITIMIAPLMTCSARLPVYVLLIGAFIPNKTVLGVFNLQGLTFFGLFIIGIFSAIAVAIVMKKFLKQEKKSTFILELPTYKMPNFNNIFRNILIRAKIFLKKAGTIIMGVSVSLWFLSTYPTPPDDWSEPNINYSFAGRIGQTIEPIFRPLGFDWRISTGLIPGFAAREVMVGALGTVFAIEDADEESKPLKDKIAEVWGIPTGLALLVWYIFSPQCLATFAVIKRETNSWKASAISFGYMITLAYLSAFFTYNIAKIFFNN